VLKIICVEFNSTSELAFFKSVGNISV